MAEKKMQLHALLQKIKAGKDVNFDQVVKYMPSNRDWSSVFTVEVSGKNKHKVKVKNESVFNSLLVQSAPIANRAMAAKSSLVSSHVLQCESAYMLCFTDVCSDNPLPSLQVAAVSQHKLLPLNFTPAKQAILIENQDCFFQWPKLLTHYQGLINISESDIYFSGGTRVLNEMLRPILSQYEHVKCLFDFDLAGLQMALSLQRMGYENVEYVTPTNLVNYADLFTFKPQSSASLLSMLTLCEQNNMHDLGEVIKHQKHFMEQEALLTLDA